MSLHRETGSANNLATFDGRTIAFSGTTGRIIILVKYGPGDPKMAGKLAVQTIFDDTIMLVSRRGSWLGLCRSNNS